MNLSTRELRVILAGETSDIVVITDPHVKVTPGRGMVERMSQVMADTGAVWVYADAVDRTRTHYQSGSIRDNFDFGPVVAISVSAARSVLLGDWQWGALYDLRLRLSEKHLILRIPEPLYSAGVADARPSGEKQFDYVDPRNRDYQVEMERIATAHLKRINAFLEPEFREVARKRPLTASVIIPVRNRKGTIKDAIDSVLAQKAAFPFNLIVVDNHSTDGTTELLREIQDPRLVHIIPQRQDLGIGGCWNEAIYAKACGPYAVQLDSDDIYLGDSALDRIVSELERGPYAMVVGSYTMVNFALEEIPPGLIDHREWTRENGRNNALRINGLGAPRAFNVDILRAIGGFPNTSYGEDYAVGLRLSRDYDIGRIYEPVYLCRRWAGNTDSALPPETANRYDAYKDWIRTNEIRARQRHR